VQQNVAVIARREHKVVVGLVDLNHVDRVDERLVRLNKPLDSHVLGHVVGCDVLFVAGALAVNEPVGF